MVSLTNRRLQHRLKRTAEEVAVRVVLTHCSGLEQDLLPPWNGLRQSIEETGGDAMLHQVYS